MRKDTQRYIIQVILSDGSEFYFTSIKAAFQALGRETIGVSQRRVYEYGITQATPYRNKRCTICRHPLNLTYSHSIQE